jgi:glutathione synthase/RimK-type ligase-like ATP-grasp enzyme
MKPNIILIWDGDTNSNLYDLISKIDCSFYKFIHHSTKIIDGVLIDKNLKLDLTNIDNKNTIVFGDFYQNSKNKRINDIIDYFKDNDYFFINDVRHTITKDKWKTYTLLNNLKLPVPLTAKIDLTGWDLTDTIKIKNEIKKSNLEFPLILKPVSGSKGIGVTKVESIERCIEILQLIFSVNENDSFYCILQEVIDTKLDLRFHVLKNNDESKIISCLSRSSNKDFRKNISLGGEIKEIDISQINKSVLNIVKDSVSILKNEYLVGVDVLIDNDDNVYILELNSKPAFYGPKINIIQSLLDFLIPKTKENNESLSTLFKTIF